MVEESFSEAFSSEWIDREIKDRTSELVILRKIIPWHSIIKNLVQFSRIILSCLDLESVWVKKAYP